MAISMIRFLFVSVFVFVMAVSNADENIIDNPSMLYSLDESYMDNNDILMTKITIKHTFNNINDLVNELNSINDLSAKLISTSSTKSKAVYVYLDNGTIKDLLNQTSKKLGYTWVLHDNEILFCAITPTPAKDVVSSSNKDWSMSPKDKTLRGAFTKWCSSQNWQLVWNVRADYPIDTYWTINTSFESAINEVLKATQHSEMPLMAIMHDSNHVLEIYSPITSK